ncbi:hypothetical protein F5888DRAFT_1742498 [Russula emetica]|nr:hypothetical protein F5888DRAFT_1742498 [Russula emetica]
MDNTICLKMALLRRRTSITPQPHVQLEENEVPDPSLEAQPENPESAQEIEYTDSSAQLWGVIFKEGEKYDKTLAESWKGDMDGILFFTGLFAVTVAVFIIDGYKYLIRNSSDTTNQLLTQISQQLSASATGSAPPAPLSIPSFNVPGSMLRVNILWFLSLTLSVTCALAATLVQQWARKYLLTTQIPSSPQRRARVRTYLFQGVLRFRLGTIATAVPFLLHASVFLFFAGLIEFLFHINHILAWVLLGCVLIGVKIYVVFTVLPLCYRDCPYMTPMSGLLWRFVQAFQFAFLSTFRRISEIISPKWTSRRINLKEYVGKCKGRLFGGLQHDLEKSAIGAAPELDAFSMGWTLKSLREPSELESFIAGIPGFLGSVATTSDPPQLTPSSITLYSLLHASDIRLGHRIGHLLKTQLHTSTVCVDALWHITCWFDAIHVPQWDRVFGEATLDSLRALKGSRDPAIALVARCAAALSVRVVLKEMRRVFSQAATTKALRIVELRKVLQALMEAERPNLVSLTDEEILRDGNLLGIADVLTGVVPLLPGVDKTRAKFLWDTLETLRFGFDLNQVTPGARIAIGDAWRAYEEEFYSWELAPPVFPRQPPGTIDHYRARMQDLVGPMVFRGTGAT